MGDGSRSRRAVLRSTMAVAGTVTLAGCGGQDSSGSTPTGTPTEPPPAAPTLNMTFDYDPSAGTLEITHAGGDNVNASRIYVRGEGFAEADGADLTAAGQWAGAASGEFEGEPAIVAGDSVTVGVAADYAIQVVWEPAGYDVTETLAEDSGPDA